MSYMQNRPRGSDGAAKRNGSKKSFISDLDYTNPGGRTPVFVVEKIVGYVQGQTFFKRIKSSKHFLRKPPAIAFDTSSLCDAELLGARFVQVTDSESGKVYKASIDQIWVEGFSLNRGHGQQQALHLSKWNCGSRPVSRQLSLFGVSQ